MKPIRVFLFSLAGVALSTSLVSAQVSIRVPFVQVETGGPGGGVFVKAPFVTVNVPPSYPVYYPPGVQSAPVLPQPQPFMPNGDPAVVIPPKFVGVAPTVPIYVHKTVMTHYDFAKVFVPVPGKHQVTLIHAGSGCPVDVCFTLPPGCPKVCTGHRYLEFDYGRCQVEIRFALFGKVRVEYDD